MIEMANTPIFDKRINSYNYMVNITIKEYYELVKDSLKENEYQRRRVRNSSSIYSLLKQDIIDGCVMPPIVLAISEQMNDNQDIVKFVLNNKCRIQILDGLQRSYTIKEIIDEYETSEEKKSNVTNALDHLIRVEIYTGINKMGILYRMLTLNTGQTQMSTRHQIEIIYSDYKKKCDVNGVVLLAEVDEKSPENLGEYRFRDVVEGFTSYLQKDYLTMDRVEILDAVKNLERLSNEKQLESPFDAFLQTYFLFSKKMVECCPLTFDESSIDYDFSSNLYAKNVIELFNKSQSLTGFGHAVAFLQDNNQQITFEKINSDISMINKDDANIGVFQILIQLDKVRTNAKKIGNDQRFYFYRFFRSLFDAEGESFLSIIKSAKIAYNQYEHMML